MEKLESQSKIQFKNHFGFDAKVITVSPVPLMILGDHTHYNEGILLSGAVNSYVGVAVSKSKLSTIKINSNFSELNISCNSPEEIEKRKNENFVFMLVHYLYQEKIISGGFNCHIESKIPKYFGLGTIAAIQIGLLKALQKIFRFKATEKEIAEISMNSSTLAVGKISNKGSHYTVLKNRSNSMLSTDLRKGVFRNFDIDSSLKIVITDTGVEFKEIRDLCNARIEECEVGVKGLRLYIWGIKSLRDVNPDFLEKHTKLIPQRIAKRCIFNVSERMRVELAYKYLRSKKWDLLGGLIFESHESLSYDYEVSSPEVDFVVEASKKIKGVLGTKMISCSAVRGTFSLVEENSVSNFKRQIAKNYKEKYGNSPEFDVYDFVDGFKIFN